MTHLVLLMQYLTLLCENNGLCHLLGIHWVIPIHANKQTYCRVHRACEGIIRSSPVLLDEGFHPDIFGLLYMRHLEYGSQA